MSFFLGSFEAVQDDFSNNYTPIEAVECCGASTARCNACKQGISEEEYCETNPSALGCESQPDAQTTMFDRDGWTSSESLLRTTNASERRVKRNAMASATTEQDLDIAITEARAAGVSHIVIQQHQRRLDSMRGDDSDTIESRMQRYEDALRDSPGTPRTQTQSTPGGGGSFHTSSAHSSASHSFTGRDCSMLSNISRRACFFGYTTVRTYCQSEGMTDPTCKTYVDSSDYTDGYTFHQRPDFDEPDPEPDPEPERRPPDPSTYESTYIMVGIGFLLIIIGFIAYRFYVRFSDPIRRLPPEQLLFETERKRNVTAATVARTAQPRAAVRQTTTPAPVQAFTIQTVQASPLRTQLPVV